MGPVPVLSVCFAVAERQAVGSSDGQVRVLEVL